MMRKTLCNHADLLRLLSEDIPLDATADLFGFLISERDGSTPAKAQKQQARVARTVSIDHSTGAADIVLSDDWPRAAEPATFWATTQYWKYSTDAEVVQPTSSTAVEEIGSWQESDFADVERKSIAPWSELLPRIRQRLIESIPSKAVDVPAAVTRLSRGECLNTVPHKQLRRWGSRVQVIVDHSQRLTPFLHDQRQVLDEIQQIYEYRNVEVGFYDEALATLKLSTPKKRNVPYRLPAPSTPIIVLSDFGALTRQPRTAAARWVTWAREVASHNGFAIGIAPCNASRVHREIRAAINVLSWQPPSRYQGWDAPERRRECVADLLTLLAPASRIEPGLLRAVRADVLECPDASIEADFWMSSEVESKHLEAASLNSTVAQEELMPALERLASQKPVLVEQTLDLLRHWRHLEGEEVWIAELWKLLASSVRPLISEKDQRIAELWLVNAALTLRRSGHRPSRWKIAWIARSTEFATMIPVENPQVKQLYRLTHPETEDRLLPGDHPSAARSVQRRQLIISQLADLLCVEVDGSKSSGCSFAAGMEANTDWITVEKGHREESFWKSGTAPGWASDWGSDRYGQWAEFQVEYGHYEELTHQGRKALHGETPATITETQVVTQRMRWIRPGTFIMGSPEHEEGRDGDEGPQRPVTLTVGFWMFDTPVTQQLWQAVMGDTPGQFKGGQRPVEQVSWDDAQKFISNVNQQTGLDLALPTEAQWEYACRAGTQTRYAFGDELTAQQAAFDRSDGTVDAGSYEPNPWGLYDMHGNVWEWCQDWWSNDYADAETTDPQGPREGRRRVMRGGSWAGTAQDVRSAYRSDYPPVNRGGDFGFRCAQVQAAAEPWGGAWPPGGAQAAATTSGEAAEFKIDPRRTLTFSIPDAPAIIIKSDVDTLRLQRVTKPPWAHAIGRDRYGLWAEFRLSVSSDHAAFTPLQGDADSTTSGLRSDELMEVRQRMRWIPPGRFLMGSPSDDEMAAVWETPQHEVVISHGYWLFDTPVRQSLWTAVMSDNPSKFQGLKRPVERVSWDQSQEFLRQIGKMVDGLELALPTEAEWEYACRAGTQTRYAFGDELTTQQAAFKLNDGTVNAASFGPNPWGLYDMHGNVWEWCQDWWSGYADVATVAPQGPTGGRNRVVRGGSWAGTAQYVRSAYRNDSPPAVRDGSIGFRCAQVHPSSRTASKQSEGRGVATEEQPE